jgi:putative ABC transport system permease protein
VNSLKRNLDLLDLAWALGLVAIAIGLAQWQRLGIAEQMAIAAARSLLQLLVMGFGLQLVWQLNRPLVTIGATIAASNRISDKAKNLIRSSAGRS